MNSQEKHLSFTRALVRSVLEDRNRKWTVQGFGFLRTYCGPSDNVKKYRLNLWNSKFTVPDVSTIHDHPWDLTSLIIAGNFCNQRYEVRQPQWESGIVEPSHQFTTIKTGVGGGVEKSPVELCQLVPVAPEFYLPGDTYHQHADEVHETKFMDGAVTLNLRIGDTEHARVFWPYGTGWVDAIPRDATEDEVRSAVASSLRDWF